MSPTAWILTRPFRGLCAGRLVLEIGDALFADDAAEERLALCAPLYAVRFIDSDEPIRGALRDIVRTERLSASAIRAALADGEIDDALVLDRGAAELLSLLANAALEVDDGEIRDPVEDVRHEAFPRPLRVVADWPVAA